MFKVEFEDRPDRYINADNFHGYDEMVTFFIEHTEDRPFGYPNLGYNTVSTDYGERGVRSEVVAAIAKRYIFSITKVDGLPFTQGQTGDTGEDI